MAVLLKLLLLICTVEIARAQFPEGDRGNSPSRRLPTVRTSVRFLPRQAARSSAVTPTILPNPRLRRPIPIKSRPTSEANEIQQVTLPRAKPTFLPTLKSENLSTPPPQLLQQDQPIKPVSEEAKEEEEDINQSFIKQLNGLHAFPQPTGNLFSSPLTPKPEPIFQYRPGFNSPVFIPRPIQYQQQQVSPSPSPSPTPAPTPSPTPTPTPTTQTTLAQQLHEEIIAPVQYRPPKPVKFRKPVDEEEIRSPVKQHRKQHQQPQQQTIQSEVISPPQQYRPQADQWRQQPVNKQSGKKAQYREKKPVAQVVRRWREDNSDGSITWGYENDDGSYKEEVIGVDCITRGKYGYIDLDGIKREYTYVTGIKCDEQETEELQDDLNGFVDYQENKLVFPNGKTIDLSSMGKKQSRRPQHAYRN